MVEVAVEVAGGVLPEIAGETLLEACPKFAREFRFWRAKFEFERLLSLACERERERVIRRARAARDFASVCAARIFASVCATRICRCIHTT